MTAKEHFRDYFKETGYMTQEELYNWGAEFAKYCVELSIKEIAKERNHPDSFYEEKTWWIPQDSILNAYSLDEIK